MSARFTHAHLKIKKIPNKLNLVAKKTIDGASLLIA